MADGLTFGELMNLAEGRWTQERRRMQQEAIIAYQQVGLVAQMLSGGAVQEIYEVFPFWDEEEVRALRVEKVRQRMERYVAAGKGGEKNGRSAG